MLVLNRKESERIVIGSDVVVTVVQIRGNRVRLAISAPQDVRVLRGELSLFDEAPSVQPERERSTWSRWARFESVSQFLSRRKAMKRTSFAVATLLVAGLASMVLADDVKKKQDCA